MGTYINIGSAGFQRARNSEYVDKSGLIAMAIELKYDKAVGTAISQIKEKHYPEKVADSRATSCSAASATTARLRPTAAG